MDERMKEMGNDREEKEKLKSMKFREKRIK